MPRMSVQASKELQTEAYMARICGGCRLVQEIGEPLLVRQGERGAGEGLQSHNCTAPRIMRYNIVAHVAIPVKPGLRPETGGGARQNSPFPLKPGWRRWPSAAPGFKGLPGGDDAYVAFLAQNARRAGPGKP